MAEVPERTSFLLLIRLFVCRSELIHSFHGQHRPVEKREKKKTKGRMRERFANFFPISGGRSIQITEIRIKFERCRTVSCQMSVLSGLSELQNVRLHVTPILFDSFLMHHYFSVCSITDSPNRCNGMHFILFQILLTKHWFCLFYSELEWVLCLADFQHY